MSSLRRMRRKERYPLTIRARKGHRQQRAATREPEHYEASTRAATPHEGRARRGSWLTEEGRSCKYWPTAPMILGLIRCDSTSPSNLKRLPHMILLLRFFATTSCLSHAYLSIQTSRAMGSCQPFEKASLSRQGCTVTAVGLAAPRDKERKSDWRTDVHRRSRARRTEVAQFVVSPLPRSKLSLPTISWPSRHL